MKFLLILAARLSLALANYDKSKFEVKSSNFLIPDKEYFLIEREDSSALKTSRGSRIENGIDAADIDYPYAVELSVRWRTGQFQTCTGAILSTSYIITARKCLLWVVF